MCEPRLRNRTSGIYKCPDNIKNFKISIKFKKVQSSQHDLDFISSETEYQIFSWQEKVFSSFELNYYSDLGNCFTDLDLKYHDMLVNYTKASSRLFSYVQEDAFCLNEETVTTDLSPNMTKLHQEMSKLKLKSRDNLDISEYNFKESLGNSQNNLLPNLCYETMYIMADLATSGSTSNLLKSQYVLCCIKYDSTNKILWLYPDYSSSNPYRLEIDVDSKNIYEYFIDNISIDKSFDAIERDSQILEKVNKRSIESNTELLGVSCVLPPKNTLRVLFILEILTAKNFEYDNIYVQYNIELPKNWSSLDETSLFGTTQTSQVTTEENVAHFGFYTELMLEYQTLESEIKELPCVYFQIVSHDNWDRYRAEGLCYTHIPVFQPEVVESTLHCLRICSKGVTGNLRRYFVGDYSNIDDVSWINIPKEHEGETINKYGVLTIGTGSIDVRLNVLNQSKALKIHKRIVNENTGLDRPGTSSLVKSISDVLVAFRRAREKMLKARKNVFNIE